MNSKIFRAAENIEDAVAASLSGAPGWKEQAIKALKDFRLVKSEAENHIKSPNSHKIAPLIWVKNSDGSLYAITIFYSVYRVHPNKDSWYLQREYKGTGGIYAAEADYASRVRQIIEYAN